MLMHRFRGALAEGRALVTVDLQIHKALGWAFNIPDPFLNFSTTPLAFGARVLDVVAGKTPALGDSHFRIVFVNTAPGAPLPDLVGLNFDPVFCPSVVPFSWSNVDYLSIQASITGLLHAPDWPEGTLGRLNLNQIVPLDAANRNGGRGPLSDAAPVESIALIPLGN